MDHSTLIAGRTRLLLCGGPRPSVQYTTCRHVLRVGGTLDFRQAFTAHFREGLISKWTAYEPYGPNGMAGVGLKIGHFFYRIGEGRKPSLPNPALAAAGIGRTAQSTAWMRVP